MKLAIALLLAAGAITSTNAGISDIEQSTPSSSSDCAFACPEIYTPVCGSDGVTYSNECFLHLAACNSKSNITQVSNGECATSPSASSEERSASSDGSTSCPEVCPRIYKPVCGSDGVTYSNDCVLGAASCKSGGAITQISDGECPVASSSSTEEPSANTDSVGCPDACLDVYEPVADENGVQYPNECYMRMAKCQNGSVSSSSLGQEVSGEKNLSLSSTSDSSCANKVCTMAYAPVCGSDGVTYSNSCMLSIASCKDSSITRAGDGKCIASEGS